MKYIIISLLLLIVQPVRSQVYFSEVNTYKPGEAVKVTILSDRDKVGVYNDIKQVSEEVSPGEVVLGTPTIGYYRIDFLLDENVKETYFIFILPDGGSVTSSATIDRSIEESIFDKMYSYVLKEENSRKILAATKDAFLKTNAVSAGFTVTMCLSSYAVPVLLTICGPGLVQEASAMSTIYFRQLILAMKQDGVIDESTYQNYDKIARGVNYVVVLGTDLASSGLAALIAGSSIVLNETLDDETIRLLVGSHEHIAKKAISIISVVK